MNVTTSAFTFIFLWGALFNYIAVLKQCYIITLYVNRNSTTR